MTHHLLSRAVRLVTSLVVGLFAVAALLFFMGHQSVLNAHADPIDPPEGYPKLILSTKVVSPILTGTTGATLEYVIEIVNTGAYMADGVSLVDVIPDHTSHVGTATSSVPPAPIVDEGVLTWDGTVGFDSTVVVTFNVEVETDYAGIISNTAVISHPMIPEPVAVTAETTVTDDPILEVAKTSAPDKPGAGKTLTYELEVTNVGQAGTLDITLVDEIPADTTFDQAGPDGSYNNGTKEVTWERTVDLGFQESEIFTFSVTTADVPSGTVISNVNYSVDSDQTDPSAGELYTVTVIDPILYISKDVQPYPPGSNRDMTYILTVLNKGSLATDLEIRDDVPDGVTYVDGGTEKNGTVTWEYPSLDTDETAQFTYTVYIADIAEVDILNETYEVCSAEVPCVPGEVLTSVVQGPTFEATAELFPIAKKPGGGGGPVTPTLTVKNIGPGNALDAVATVYFKRISVSKNDMEVDPSVGLLSDGPDCGEKCSAYVWVGDIAVGEMITFTTIEGQSTIGGAEGTNYTATVVITDNLGAYTTEAITATAVGTITHYANLIPIKTGPTAVGAGNTMTYTIEVWNSGLSTDDPPLPMLVETLPLSVSFVSASDGGVAETTGDQTVISWTLPAMSPGDRLWRYFSVLVDSDLLSGTEIINADYHTLWHNEITETMYLSNTGQPFTTVVKEVGLIDSFKTVTPTLARPGPSNVLTYVVHVVNSSQVDLQDVEVEDLLPWEHSTYQRDAVASSGDIISDIVSIHWTGNVAALSSERITLTVDVDPFYEGPLTNTAWIRHDDLRDDVLVEAVAYITDDPILQISKSASPDPVLEGGELLYMIEVANLGQQATNLEVWDTLPENTEYVPGSASANGKLVGDQVYWELLELPAESTRVLSFKVKVTGGEQVVNSDYGVDCPDCEMAVGQPVITEVTQRGTKVYLPILFR